MKKMLSLTGFALSLVFLISAASAADLPDFVDLAKKAGPAVVNISTEREVSGGGGIGNMIPGLPPGMERFFEQFGPFQRDQTPQRQSSLGSGFIISGDGYIVTNNHVVEGADKIFVNLEGETDNPLEAKVIGTDKETDLALLKVDPANTLPTLEFGDSDALEVGSWVMSIGNPFGLSNTVTAGILSAKGRDIHAGPFDNFLQTDASINPGNSGGPLINMTGQVIGINTAIVATGQGIGFAIPSNLAKQVVAELQTGKGVSRGWLGVAIQDLDQNMAKALGMDDTKGALVGSVMPDQPAEKAGMQSGDIIVKINETNVTNASELLRTIADFKPGTEVQVVVMRNGKEMTFKVDLGSRANGTESSQLDTPQAASGGSLGLSVRPVTREDLRSLQLPTDTKGLLVVEVQSGSPADKARIMNGDVILSANLQPVTNVEALINIIKNEAQERGAVMLQINRRGETSFITVELEK